MPSAYINRIGTAVPDYDVHQKFIDYAPRLLTSAKARRLFTRMAERAQIEHRYSYFAPDPNPERLDRGNFYLRGRFPDTQTRMRFYEDHAFELACQALADMRFESYKDDITHLIVVSCTGFYAPGLDLQIIERFGMNHSVERTTVGFMGCYAAINALKLARHIVHAVPGAKALVLNLELCTVHLQEADDLEQVLSFLVFADGCSATLVTAEQNGAELLGFRAMVAPESAEQITWRIGEYGFDMHLSGRVPHTIGSELPARIDAILGQWRREDIELWAVHPGGRSVLDAVENALDLCDGDLHYSREVLRSFGNMSSATVMFILKRMIEDAPRSALGCALAFGPGLTTESMLFRIVR
ncbi:MAG TPA: type III polyketide synthase [Gammaproteobacteria bacterium]|nr:type III polyketide synthase [Gammaproteobacteria bacterium]